MANRGRPSKYLTVELFNKFLGNDFWHVKRNVKVLVWLNSTILGSIVVWALIDRLVSTH